MTDAAITRYEWPIHVLIALPWAVAAVAVLVLGLAEPGGLSPGLAVVPALVAIGLLLARRLWLAAVAILGALAGLLALSLVGLAYVNAVPSDPLALFAYRALTPAAYIGLVACLAAAILGVIEFQVMQRTEGTAAPRS